MTLEEFRARLAQRAEDAERTQATAPLAATYRALLSELADLEAPPSGNGHRPTSLRQFLTAREIAAALDCSPRYVYQHAKDWPFTRRLGALVRFDAEGFARWRGGR